MNNAVELSVVIPVYGAKDCLEPLHERLTKVLSKLVSSYEIVLMEDCSPDGSWDVVSALAEEDTHVKAYRLSRNFGQHAAITAGLAQCTGQWAVVMDCDLQDPPEEIPRLYEQAKQGYEIVFARRKEKRHSFFRKLAAKCYFGILNKLTKRSLDGEYGSFSLISRKVIDAFVQVQDKGRHYLLILFWLGFPSTSVEYQHAERYSGKSAYTFSKLIRHALEGVFFQTTTVLHWIIYLGFLCSLLGMLISVYLIAKYFTQYIMPGWTSLVVLVLMMSGIILICLGIVGLYVGQIFEQVQGRPLYVIAEKRNAGEAG